MRIIAGDDGVFESGARTLGGDLGIASEIDNLLSQFSAIVEKAVEKEQNIRRRSIRCLLPGSFWALVDNEHLFVVGQKHFGMPSSLYSNASERIFTSDEVLDASIGDIGFDDPFLITFPKALLTISESERLLSLEAIASTYIESEFQRMLRMTSLIQINPLFGPAAYSLNRELAFVIMPFKDELNNIFDQLVKPVVMRAGLLCRRADDLKTNRVIMQDIWQSICQARIIIADLTGLNPNVMYELGIAHTVGKDTILIYQQQAEELRFPFDLAHIRRIIYTNDAIGGKKLQTELEETIQYVLNPKVVS
jgi:hypothetical protein